MRSSRGTTYALRRALVVLTGLSALACLVAPGPAAASEKLTDNAAHISIKVDNAGHAVVYWTRAGRPQHAAVWGAVNARAPSRSQSQVSFKVDYSGGFQKLHKPLWKTIRNRCRPYDGPKLPWFVTGCRAPDGSYWALQRFPRLLPDLGIDPWLPRHRALELHVSHWSGPVATLDAVASWAGRAAIHEVVGRLM